MKAPGLLAGADAAIASALAEAPVELPKQLALRFALHRIGMDWIATNTTPCRTFLGASWREQFGARSGGRLANENVRSRKRKREDIIASVACVPQCWPSLPADCIRLKDKYLDASSLETLKRNGVVVLRGGVSAEGCTYLRACAAELVGGCEQRWLAETEGNGRAGFYQTFPRSHPGGELLQRISEAVATLLPGVPAPARTIKELFLCYGDGGENFAHQDAARFPYQVPTPFSLLSHSDSLGAQCGHCSRTSNQTPRLNGTPGTAPPLRARRGLCGRRSLRLAAC